MTNKVFLAKNHQARIETRTEKSGNGSWLSLIVYGLILAFLFSSCGVTQKWCPSQDKHFFYRAQGLKKPVALQMNERGYSRPKLRTRW